MQRDHPDFEPVPGSAAIDMIDAVYGAVLDHDRFDELIDLTVGYLPDDMQQSRFAELRALLENHLARAETMLHRLPQEPDSDPEDVPHFDLSRAGVILDANEAARSLFGTHPGSSVFEFDIPVDMVSALRDFLSGQSVVPPVLRLTRLDTATPYVVSVEPAPGGRGARCRGIDALWSDEAGEALRTLFKLSRSESEVLGLLLSGLSPIEVAERRARSIETVRQQIKAMLAKTHSGGIQDLIHLARAVTLSTRRSQKRGGGSATGDRRGLHRLPDGRVLDYARQGDPDAEAVFFLHGCLCGNRFPAAAVEALRARSLQVIAPARPNHGQSSGKEAFVNGPDLYARDLLHLADHLGIERFHIVAFDIGTIYALMCARHVDHRVTGLTCISAQPPIAGLADIASMPTQQRVFALMPKLSVPLLRFMAKAGDKRLQRIGESGFPDIVFRDAPADIRACEDPELLRLFWNGHLFHVENGSEGFIDDCRVVASNWFSTFVRPAMPIRFLHGEENATIPPERIFGFAEKLGARMTLVPGAGHTLPFTHWDAVFDAIISD